MGNFITPGPYPDNPLVGNRPMKYPYTFAAKFAQYPYKFMWNYSIFYRFMLYGFLATLPLMYKIEKLSYTPSNVEEWKERRRQWYEVKHPPEYDCY